MNLSKQELEIETKWLEKTTTEIRKKISELGQQLYDKEEKIQEFKKFMWDSRHDMDPTEMRTMEAVNDIEVAMALRKSQYYQKLFKVQNSPYFGSLLFKDDSGTNRIYIGITHVEDEDDNHLVHDWRAPICSMFYDYETGKASYTAPEGVIEGEILNKRQFKISFGKLIRVFDSNINIDDDVLQEVLVSKSSEKMKNIVNTIQQEQNAIIRNTEDRNLIVQGIAGSGKTSVALHRIAFLLYKLEKLNSKNVLIFSPNQVFSEYISNVLPELGEDNTMQTTFHDFLSNYLNEFNAVESFTSFIERHYKHQNNNIELTKYKQSDEIIDDLNNYIRDIVNSAKIAGNFVTREFEISEDELNDLFKERYGKLLIFDRISEMADYLSRKYYEESKAKKRSIEATLLKMLSIKRDYKNIFVNFFKSKYFIKKMSYELSAKECKEMVKNKEIKYDDACIMAYIKGLIEGFDYQGQIKQVVIDEAQDYNKMQYILIKKIFAKSDFTLLGDINQTVNPYYKYDSLDILKDIFGTENTKYLELSKTYRSTPEIIEYTNKILGLQHVSAIRRETKVPVVFRNKCDEKLFTDIMEMRKKHSSVAIITKTDEEALNLYEKLKNDVPDISLVSSNSKEFNKRLVIVPVYIAKGLEFDAVIIYTNENNQYKEDEKYLYYVACTRCQHELIVYNQKN